MKILLFIESVEPGGAEEVVCLLARAVEDRGWSSLVVTLERGWLTSELHERGLECVQLSSDRRLDVALPIRLAGIIGKQRFDLLHSHLLDSIFYGSIAARVAGVPHLATDHGDIHLPRAKRFLRSKLRWASLLGTRFTAVSRYTAGELGRLGVPRQRIRLLPNPLVCPPETTAQERARARERLGVGADDWVWLHTAMLRAVKDQETLIRGFAAAVRESRVPQRLFLAGEGPLRPRLETLCHELGLEDRVRLLGFRNDVKELLKGADGFVLSSLSEALPMSLLEAGAGGLLLIGSRVGGLSEVIDHDRTGWLFDSGNHRQLAALMLRAVDETRHARALARSAQRMVRERFSVENVMRDYSGICRGLVAGSNRSRG